MLSSARSFSITLLARKFGGNHLTHGLHCKADFRCFLPQPTQYPAHGCTLGQSSSVQLDWLLSRVLELSFTAWDLAPFACDCGYDGPPFRWNDARRFLLRCELDAAFFHLYGVNRDDTDYIMETFPVVKKKDMQQHGDYRTKHRILEIYDAMQRAIETGEPYQTRLDPPPADPRVAHSTERGRRIMKNENEADASEGGAKSGPSCSPRQDAQSEETRVAWLVQLTKGIASVPWA